jgi:ankyrin repeat protein
MTDSAIMNHARGLTRNGDITSLLLNIASTFRLSTADLLTRYQKSRGFNSLHLALLRLNDPGKTLKERLTGTYKGENLVNQADHYGRSPLTWATEYRWEEAIQCLLSLGGSVKLPRLAIDMRRSLPILHLAIAGPPDANLTTIVELLLDAGADVYEQDDERWTALHVAASWGMFDVAKLLLRENDTSRLLTLQTATGETACDLARESGFRGQILSLLTDK